MLYRTSTKTETERIRISMKQLEINKTEEQAQERLHMTPPTYTEVLDALKALCKTLGDLEVDEFDSLDIEDEWDVAGELIERANRSKTRVPESVGPKVTEGAIRKLMEERNLSYYGAREKLREIEYGGKAPDGYASWGDYWKFGV